MTLFLKIFLWFWLAIAVVVGVLTLVNWTLQTEPLVRQWQLVAGDIMNINTETAAQIFEAEGKSGLDAFLVRLENSERVLAIGFFDGNGIQIAGSKFPDSVENIVRTALDSGNVEFDKSIPETVIAKKTNLKTGESVVLVSQSERFRPTNFARAPQTQIIQFALAVLAAGLFCYGLAFYLTAPIVKLRLATRKLADGDLQTRVGRQIGKRRDELSGLAKDFDEMAERIESLVTTEKRLTQDISHELRSPLARLNVALELARAKANPETETLLNRIETESTRVNEMISHLLMLSKLETDSQTFEKKRINLTRLFEQVVSDGDFEAAALGKAVKILHKDEAEILGNENLLRSAIENVLRNAVRYTKDATTVEVSLKKENKKISVTVRDFGAGVPEVDLKKLFRPFYRVQTARDRKSGGIGLGLAIAERAVNVHHGAIEAQNIGDGLVVKIDLPSLA
jgi:two-component system sensor histidine kinase CpxA